MRVFLASLIVAMVLPFIAVAAEDVKTLELCGLDMPCVCEIDCVCIDIDCCCCDGSNDAIVVEFLDKDGMVLGTAIVQGPWCGPCDDGSNCGSLDKPVNPYDVCKVRVTKPGEDTIDIDYMRISVGYMAGCKYKYSKIFKQDICCSNLGEGEGDYGAFILY